MPPLRIFPLFHSMKEPFFLTWTEPEPEKGPIIKILDTRYSETDEVEELVKEWYRSRNEPVPAYEYEFINVWRKSENEENEYSRKIVSREIVLEVKDTNPAFGTPEFWKAYWIKKKAKQAEDANKDKNDTKSVSSTESKKAKKTKKPKDTKPNDEKPTKTKINESTPVKPPTIKKIKK
jgi:hypothetical protein